ncbi:carboxypeptidase-like regulatory domain-containing protein [Deltaproteobacteria bacterium TL4]
MQLKKYLLIAGIFIASLCFADQTPGVTVEGQVVPPSGKSLPVDGVEVVLLKFGLDAQGTLSTNGPLAKQKTDSKGYYKFTSIPVDTKAAYRIGSNLEEDLFSSEYFFMQEDKPSIKVDLVIPGTSIETDKLQLPQISLFIEANIGRVLIAEVLYFNNPTKEAIDTYKTPLIIDLPKGATEVQMVGQNQPEQPDYEIFNNYLQLMRRFPPGNTQIIVQYFLSSSFGSLTVEKEFRLPFQEGQIFTLTKVLQIESEDLQFTGTQTMGDSEFLSWKIRDLASKPLTLTIQNIPTSQTQYTSMGVVIFALLLIFAVAFIKFRL